MVAIQNGLHGLDVRSHVTEDKKVRMKAEYFTYIIIYR